MFRYQIRNLTRTCELVFERLNLITKEHILFPIHHKQSIHTIVRHASFSAHVTLAVMIIGSKIRHIVFPLFFLCTSRISHFGRATWHASKCMQYAPSLASCSCTSTLRVLTRRAISYCAEKSRGRKFPRFIPLSAGSFSWLVIRQFVIILACLAASCGNLKAL